MPNEKPVLGRVASGAIAATARALKQKGNEVKNYLDNKTGCTIVRDLIATWMLAAGQNERSTSKNTIRGVLPEAPVGFDDQSNGVVDAQTHQTDQSKFEQVETIADGLGPLYTPTAASDSALNHPRALTRLHRPRRPAQLFTSAAWVRK